MDNNNIYKKAEGHVISLFEKMDSEKFVFHNLQHTKNVVHRTKEIAAHYKLSERDMLILYVAAWFHDTGYLYSSAEEHEEKGVELMREFMNNCTKDDELIDEVAACILVTKPPRKAVNLMQEIICDADTYHFGTKEFKDTNKKVYEEFSLRQGKNIDKLEWNDKTLEMLREHNYYTSYCKDLLNKRKKKITNKLQRKIQKNQKNATSLKIDDANSLTIKGIQTMLRLTSENHLKLSDMADHKANILISVNAIMISVILGVLMRKLEDEPYLTIPTIIFLLMAVTTIVIAILATRPKVSGGIFSEEDVAQKKINLLFFGNFHKASFEQYDVAMRKMMKDPDYLYGSLVRDIYQLGVVLGRKYWLIRIAYYIFMIGIVVAVLSFAIAVFFYSKKYDNAASGGNIFPF